MALNLDHRQRAMLQDMGITVWWPQAAPAAANTAAVQTTTAVIQAPAAPAVALQPVNPTSAPAVRTEVSAAANPAPASAPATTVPLWNMAPAVQAYPQATGTDAHEGWLVIWECAHAAAPLSGDSGKLLDNMLRALRLHHSPHIWIAGIQRAGSESRPLASVPTPPVDWQPLATALPLALRSAQPARLLVLGLNAARAVLNSQEALGRLRAQIHHVHNVPAVVSYDPAYLLRSPHAKPATWADLCRAHALHPPSGQA